MQKIDPTTDKPHRICFTVTKDQYDRLLKLANSRKKSLSQFLRELVDEEIFTSK